MVFPNKPSLYHCILVFVFVLPSCSMSQPNQNVTLGSSLTATQHNNEPYYWSSQSGDFAFGFRQLGSDDGYSLAIWFNKIDDKTVIWSANRDSLAPTGSTIQLTNRGQLVLNDPEGTEIWTADSYAGINGSVSYAAMLDTGNFVLAANNSEFLWQSFHYPTDTLLPSQTLIQNKTLVARYSEKNYKSGRFQLWMQSDGNLVLYGRESPYGFTQSYWASNSVGTLAFQVVFNLSGSIDLIDSNNTIIRHLMSNTNSTQNYYHRAILDSDGVFRQYVYPKTANSSSIWSKVSQVPDPANVCAMTAVGTGIGMCGFNSYCMLGNDQSQSHSCLCLPGYVFIDSNDVLKGCKPDFVPHSCDQSLPETDSFQLVPLDHMIFTLFDYEVSRSVNEDQCRSECLSECFCTVAIFSANNCWKKKFPLSFGRTDPSDGGRALIKIRRDNTTSKPKPNNNLVEIKHRNKVTIVIGSVLLGSSVFLNFLLFLLTLFICYRFNKTKSKVVLQGDPLILGVNMRIFGYEELNKATSGFVEQLGHGSFATVYKGIIDSGDNNLVAIKKLDNAVQQGDQEFKAEVSAIARTNHKNLVRLLGFCNEGEHRMLVYEFMRNGSLADFLFGTSKPNWYDRIPLVLGTARGLSYLHEECGTQIIHCDIKPQNILLDDSFTARIADFGLAKLLKQDQTRTMTAIRGTKGYVAPEWFRSLPITVKVDVYSFGILLLEIICCRRSFEEKVEDEAEMVLADWGYDCFKENKVGLLVENDEEATIDMKRVKKFVMIAIWCIQEEPSLRPTMKKVVQMLEGAIEVSSPPDPSSFISAIP